MRIGLAYDLKTDDADERQAEFDSAATINALRAALQTLGHEVALLGNAYDLLQAPERLRDIELVLNIAEGLHGRNREAWVPMLLELHGVPYAGSDALTLALGLDKAMAKRLAVAAGVPTPRWISVEQPGALEEVLPLAFPLIVKPRWEGSGRGIDAGAVVRSPAALRERLEWLASCCDQPALVEEFIGGGELTVCLIGNEPTVAYPAIQRPLDPQTRLSHHVVKPPPERWECPLELDEAMDAQARRLALSMFEALGCRDMARVDFRVDEAGQLQFLEINPLPSFDPEGSFGLLAEHLGMSYPDLVGQILEAAVRRLHRAAAPRPRRLQPAAPEPR